jgi:ABC-type branched-subunit amino acid transport system substrate-binding protein
MTSDRLLSELERQQKYLDELPEDFPFPLFNAQHAQHAADSSDPTLIKQHLQAVSAPPGRAFTWQQLPQAIKAIVAGHDINYQGAWGPIDWDSRGDPTTAVYVIWKHEHGKITILRTITFRR